MPSAPSVLRRSSPDGLGRAHLVVDRVLGLVELVWADTVDLVRTQVGPARVEQVDALLDALERLHDVAFEPDEDVDRVLVRAAADILGVRLGLADDPPAVGLGLLGQPALVDQEGRLLLGLGDDPLGLLLRLLDDPLALGVDPLGGPDLLGNGDPKLVDQAEGGLLIDDDVVRQGQVLAVGDDRLEPLDEEDDVDRDALLWRVSGSEAELDDRRGGLSHGAITR